MSIAATSPVRFMPFSEAAARRLDGIQRIAAHTAAADDQVRFAVDGLDVRALTPAAGEAFSAPSTRDLIAGVVELAADGPGRLRTLTLAPAGPRQDAAMAADILDGGPRSLRMAARVPIVGDALVGIGKQHLRGVSIGVDGSVVGGSSMTLRLDRVLPAVDRGASAAERAEARHLIGHELEHVRQGAMTANPTWLTEGMAEVGAAIPDHAGRVAGRFASRTEPIMRFHEETVDMHAYGRFAEAALGVLELGRVDLASPAGREFFGHALHGSNRQAVPRLASRVAEVQDLGPREERDLRRMLGRQSYASYNHPQVLERFGIGSETIRQVRDGVAARMREFAF